MPSQLLKHVAIRGIACSVPKRRETEADLAESFGEADARRLVKGTSVRERRIDRRLSVSDHCEAAADSVLRAAGWERESIQHLILVTQYPDFVLPATACVLQDRMGLPRDCSAFDINQGCAGYPYGIWVAGRLLGPGERALLLVGDGTQYVPPDDRSTVPLFGDCGSATLLEQSTDAPPMAFTCGTDGSGFANIIVPSFLSARFDRNPAQSQGPARGCPGRLSMNGPEVFSFALQRVPGLVQHCLEMADWSPSTCDDLVFHQANGFMLKMLAEKLAFPSEKVPTSLETFGNTSSASIPLTLVSQRSRELRDRSRRYVLAGFGVGWSWSGLALELGPIAVPDLVELE